MTTTVVERGPSEETWRRCDDPHRLVRWARPVGTARTFLLAACAVARHGLGAADTKTGGRILAAVEALARGPKAGLAVRLIDDYLVPRVPDVVRAGRPYLARGGRRWADRGYAADWVAVLADHAPVPSRATKSVVNVMIDLVRFRSGGAAAADAAAEVAAVRREVAARPRKGTGRFGPLLGWLRADAGGAERAVCEAVLAKIPATRRPPVPPTFPASSLGWWATFQLQVFRAGQARWRLCDAVRDVFGDPVRRWHPHRDWTDPGGPARRLAGHIDATGEYVLLPVLADALEDAGCTDEAPLDHCRTPGHHGPGYWVVEAVLRR